MQSRRLFLATLAAVPAARAAVERWKTAIGLNGFGSSEFAAVGMKEFKVIFADAAISVDRLRLDQTSFVGRIISGDPLSRYECNMRKPRNTARLLVLLISGATAPFALAAEDAPKLPPPASSAVDFPRDIQPILAQRCAACHGPSMQMNGLRLDHGEAALKGGYSGAVIVPGDGAASKLIQRVASTKEGYRMPPAGPALSPQEVGLLRGWIDQGADWPSEPAQATENNSGKTSTSGHWSFQRVDRPPVPTVQQRAWVRNTIDNFVLARLENEGIRPSPAAEKATLIRRVSLDLTGLPPTPAEVRAFLLDNRADAYEELVDRLLRSPHYGEKWARHWLDLARYADSDGYEKDLFRPETWRWRHWVIEALNRDIPFDEFTIEQLAGDLLSNASVEQRVATGFLRNGLKNREGGVNREEARFEETVDRTNTVSTVWMGLTAGCAQCHDHKYDPITQKDYYSLFAFFDRVEDRTIDAPLAGELGPRLAAQGAYDEERARLLETYGVSKLQPIWEAKMIAAMDHPGRNTDWDFMVTSTRAMLDSADNLIRKPPEKRSRRERETLTDYFVRRPGPDFSKDDSIACKLSELDKKLEALRQTLPAVAEANILVEDPEAGETNIRLRGDYRAKGLAVEPAPPAFLTGFPQGGEPPRLRLARWLVSRENPLTARVAVNRMWQEFFGVGLVRTSEDFGTQGAKPSHPALLDWLAAEFIENGWSMKRMHKLIVMSAAYRQSSNARPDLSERDPGNTLLARQVRIRLSAELIRDAALSASGLLYPKVGGESVRPPQPEGITKLTYGEADWEESTGKDRYRRGLYVHFQRTSPYPQLVNFDAPDANTSCTRRRRSNTPLQALNLLNDPVFVEAAQAFAVRVLREQPGDWNSRIEHAFELALGREPDSFEKERLAAVFKEQKSLYDRNADLAGKIAPFVPSGVDPVEMAAWTGLGRTLLNLDAFITRE